MTTTNRAFIKAYRHDAAQGPPTAHAAAEGTRPAAVAAGSTIAFVTGGGSLLAGPPSSGATPLMASIDVVGPPAQISLDTAAPIDADGRTPKVAGPESTIESKFRRIDPPTQSKRPLSDYIARQHAAPTNAQPNNPDIVHPGTTVASFRWPAVCGVLSQRVGTELDRVATLLQERADAGNSLTGIIGLFPGSGATTVALLLAAQLAARGRRIILVDGSFCRPRHAALLDVVPTAGWQEVIRREATLDDAVIRSTGDRFDLLALTTKTCDDHLQLIAGRATTYTARLLRTTYDTALVDLGAFFDAGSQPVALELIRRMRIDAVVAVAGAGPADPRDVATIANRLEQNGCQLLGTIENRVPRASIGEPSSKQSHSYLGA